MNNPHRHNQTAPVKAGYYCVTFLLTNKKFFTGALPLEDKRFSLNASQQPLVENPVQNPAQNLWNSREKLCAKNLFNARFCNIQWKIPAPWKSCAKFYHYFSTWKIPLLKSRFSTFST